MTIVELVLTGAIGWFVLDTLFWLLGMKGLCRIIAVLAAAGAAALVPAGARGELAWSVSGPDISIGDFYSGHDGLESLCTFTIQNLSSAGDANNLIGFTLTAPADMQIFYVEPPDGWSYDNAGASVSFNGNGNYIPTGNQRPLNLYSYHLTTAQGTADATADGLGIPQPFPQLNAIPLPGVEAGWTGRLEWASCAEGKPRFGVTNSPGTQTVQVQRSVGDLGSPDWQTVTNLPAGATEWTDEAAPAGWGALYYRLAK